MSRVTSDARLADAYLSSLRLRARARRVADAIFDGIWLGVLDRRALAAVDEAFYGTTTEEVDGVPRAYADPQHVRQGLKEWERHAVSTFPPGGRVIVTSAGAGREIQGLLAAGFDAVGFEPNADLVNAGRRELAESARLEVCARDVFPADAGSADGVLIGWASYMLIAGRARRVALLAEAASVLRPGGRLVLSFFVRPPTRYFRIVKVIGGGLRRLRGAENLELGDALSPNFVHYFTPDEIRSELADAGLDLCDFRAEPYGHAIAAHRA